jgi:mRNA interferase MazF
VLLRPVTIVQGDSFNASRIATTVVVPLTSNLRLAAAPGNVILTAARTGLPKDSVANVSQLLSMDRRLLTDRVGHLTAGDLQLLLVEITRERSWGGCPVSSLISAAFAEALAEIHR